jgi:DNA polymerase III sliding clamp (beta) subunit (PCNA family)
MMRVELEGKDLAEALRNSPRGRSTLPILEHALLETGDGVLRVQTTDLEATAVTEIPAKVLTPGAICGQAALLAAAARPGLLKLSHDDADFFIAVMPRGGSRLRVPALVATQFPIPESLDWRPLEMDTTALAAAIGSLEYAAAISDHRHFLNTLALLPGYIGATNSHRLAMFIADYEGPQALLPIKQVREFARLLTPEAKLFYVPGPKEGTARMLRIQNGATMLSIALVDANYPAISDVIEKDFQERVALYTFDREKLLESARQLLPFLSPVPGAKMREPCLVLSVAEGAAQLTDLQGTNVENCSWALGDHDADGQLAVRADYLVDTLSAIKTDKVRLHIRRRVAEANRPMSAPCVLIQPCVESPKDSHLIVGVVR